MTTPPSIVVSIHDVTPPNWPRVRQTLDVLDSLGVRRRSLLVIPNFQGQWAIDKHESFCAELRRLRDAGDEIVLHGFEHRSVGSPVGLVDRFKNRWFTQGEGEFLSLNYRDARTRIEMGLALMRRAGLDVRGFVAPAWLINPAGLDAARACGLEYTNSYFRLVDLVDEQSHVCPSLVFGPGHLDEDIGISVQRRLVGCLSWFSNVRVVLHPPCINHADRFEHIVSVIAALARTRRVATYFELLTRWRATRAADTAS